MSAWFHCLQALLGSVIDVSLSVDGNDILPMILPYIVPPDPAMYPLPTSSLSSGCSERTPPTDDVVVPFSEDATVNTNTDDTTRCNDDATRHNGDTTVHPDDDGDTSTLLQKTGIESNGTPPGFVTLNDGLISAPAVNKESLSLPLINGLSQT